MTRSCLKYARWEGQINAQDKLRHIIQVALTFDEVDRSPPDRVEPRADNPSPVDSMPQ